MTPDPGAGDTRRSILQRLARADGPVAGPTLADRLGVSRAAVWKHVEALRDAGFGVESGDDGYRLVSVPEYGGRAVECGLNAPYRVEYHETIDSTNRRARDLAAAGGRNVVVLADAQTGGRGRLDRDWASPPGGVWASVVPETALSLAETPLLTLAAAAAVVRAVRPTGVDAGIKWPNDVLVPTDSGERKIAGILTESVGETDRAEWVVVGIGINANVEPGRLPAGATSLEAMAEGPVDRRAVAQRLLSAFDALRSDPGAVLPAWCEHALTLGRRVRVETGRGTVVGEAVDVERPGSLVVETADGRVRVHAGDCEHLRPA